jgi:hypothetical protein
MLDLTDHQLATISMWAEVAILAFMVWEKYGTSLGSVPMKTVESGFWSRNRTLVFAICGLGIVAWLQLRTGSADDSFPAVLLIVIGALAGGLASAILFGLFSRKPPDRHLSSRQMRILAAEFAKAELPRILFTHFDDHDRESFRYMHNFMDALKHAGVTASDSGPQSPTSINEKGIVLYEPDGSTVVSKKLSKALSAAGISHTTATQAPGQTELRFFVGPRPL